MIDRVAPPVGARVEIYLEIMIEENTKVAPPVGARVEIVISSTEPSNGVSPLPWGRE